jgi:hypothetical protein
LEALLDQQKEKACTLGKEYLTARENRFAGLHDVHINMNTGQEGDCRAAESILELEEGLADYGSWTILYNRGMASREQLMKRYRAQQNDHFYLSGAMLMHAITLMSKKPAFRIIREMAGSGSVETGGLLPVFEKIFAGYCNK